MTKEQLLMECLKITMRHMEATAHINRNYQGPNPTLWQKVKYRIEIYCDRAVRAWAVLRGRDDC
jgi:hypothetical protein